jgi:hypothetical protein
MISTKQYLDITLANIYSRISDYDIFRYYISNFTEINKPFLSELRPDKSANSVRIFRKGDNLYYKDFATNDFLSSVGYVMKKYNISYAKALNKINIDFNLGLGLNIKNNNISPAPIYDKHIIKNTKVMKQLQIVSDKWSSKYLKYWLDYGITKETLEFFNVKPLKGFYIDMNYIACKELTYAYCFGNYRYKILQPNSDFKWVSNTIKDDIQGFTQLPKLGDVLFITSSLKDVMTLYETGYSAIAPQSETANLNPYLIENLKNRFYRIVVLYDNDETGLREAQLLCEQYNLEKMIVPVDKDPSGYAKSQSLLQLKLLIDSTLF